VCIFRDQYTPLTATGFSIYGLSRDSGKANTNFKEKQKLPYSLLCDPKATLITAIGLSKEGSKTTRGVFVIDKSGKVLAAQPGSPSGTFEIVEKLVKNGEAADEKDASVPATNGANSAKKEDAAKAEVAAQVADTAERLDSGEKTAAA
jgi:peroxiredoxin Q/BCP